LGGAALTSVVCPPSFVARRLLHPGVEAAEIVLFHSALGRRLPEQFDAAATDLMWERVLGPLSDLDARRTRPEPADGAGAR
jgi:hypothetical protein